MWTLLELRLGCTMAYLLSSPGLGYRMELTFWAVLQRSFGIIRLNPLPYYQADGELRITPQGFYAIDMGFPSHGIDLSCRLFFSFLYHTRLIK